MGITEGTAANLPSLHHMRRTIRSQRTINENLPPIPATMVVIPVLPQTYQTTSIGEQFLLFDSGVGDAERLFILGSPQATQLLTQSTHWFCDGTFKVVPELFYQMYTIHAEVREKIFPIYALLPNKTQINYTRLLREVSNVVNGASPTSVMMGFERAALNSFETVFPNSILSGCYFHLSSNVWKKRQDVGLQQRYNDDEEFSIHVRMIMSLAFVTVADVVNAFNDLTDEIEMQYNTDMDDLLNYFEDTYMGRLHRNGRQAAPSFTLEIWNMYMDEPKTNYLERTIMSKVGIAASRLI